MRYLTFALAKGRLAKKTLALLEQIGITCDEMKDPDTRKLIFINEELKLKFFLSKATDVPTYVEYGAADIGVVGKDTILEEGRNLYEVMDLGFGKCRMCVCGPHKAKELLKKNEIIRVASKYPNHTSYPSCKNDKNKNTAAHSSHSPRTNMLPYPWCHLNYRHTQYAGHFCALSPLKALPR